jgi:peroxiredoxin
LADFWGRGPGGEIARLADYRGRVVFVHFWASWSDPSMKELPFLREAWRQQAKRGFAMIGVNEDATLDDLKRLQASETRRLPWPVIHDQGRALAQGLGVDTIPASFLLDPDGKIIVVDMAGEYLAPTLANYFDPDGIATLLDEWIAAGAARRLVVESMLKDKFRANPRGGRKVARDYLDFAESVSAEAAALLRRLIAEEAPGAPNDLTPMDLDALVAYHAGDPLAAAKTQKRLLEMLNASSPAPVEERAKESTYAHLLARLGLYYAESGQIPEAVACGKILWDAQPEGSPVRNSRYFKRLVQLTTGKSVMGAEVPAPPTAPEPPNAQPRP